MFQRSRPRRQPAWAYESSRRRRVHEDDGRVCLEDRRPEEAHSDGPRIVRRDSRPRLLLCNGTTTACPTGPRTFAKGPQRACGTEELHKQKVTPSSSQPYVNLKVSLTPFAKAKASAKEKANVAQRRAKAKQNTCMHADSWLTDLTINPWSTLGLGRCLCVPNKPPDLT